MADPRGRIVLSAVDRTKRAFDTMNRRISKSHRVLAGFAAALTAIGLVTVKGMSTAAANVAKFGDTVDALGIRSRESFDKIIRAGEATGASFETVAMFMQRLARNAQNAADGNETLREAFAAFGVDVAELRALAPDELYFEMAKGADAAADANLQLARAQQIVDSEGMKPLLNSFRVMNSESFQRADAALKAFGATMTEELVTKGQDRQQTLEQTETALARIRDIAFLTGIDVATLTERWNKLNETMTIAVDRGDQDELALERAARVHTARVMMAEEAARAQMEAEAEITADFAKNDVERARALEDSTAARLRNTQAMFGGMLSSASRNSKAMFAIDKAWRIAEAAMTAQSAVLNSYEFGAKLGGPALGAVFAATAAAATATNIAAIASASFGQGGGAPQGTGGSSASPGEIAGTQPVQNGGGQNFNVEFRSGTGLYSEDSLRSLFDALQEASENGAGTGLSGRFVVQGI